MGKTDRFSASIATAPSDFEDLIWTWEDTAGEVSEEWAASYLFHRGISPEVAEARGYYTPARPHLWRVSENSNDVLFTEKEFTDAWDGIKSQRPLAIPLYGLYNEHPSTVQLRPRLPIVMHEDVKDKAGRHVMVKVRTSVKDAGTGVTSVRISEVRKTEPKDVKFLVPFGHTRKNGRLPAPDVHPWVSRWLGEEDADAPLRVLLTEGTLKADAALSAAARSGGRLATLSLTGVTMGYLAGGQEGNTSRHPQLSDGMRGIDWEGREVLLAWDPDWRAKPAVRTSLMVMAKLLAGEGAIVTIADIPASDSVNGLDDFLADSPDDAIWSLFESALAPADAERESRTYEHTDLARGERLSDEMLAGRTRYKFNSTSGRALRWMDTHWVDDRSDSILYNLAGSLAKRDSEDEAGRSLRALSAAVKVAASRDGVSVSAEDLDADGLTLNTPSGEIYLPTGEVHPHNPDSLHTMITASAVDFEMPTPIWDRFLADVTRDDEELVQYLKAVAGMGMYGIVHVHAMVILLGAGRDGKSTFVDALKRAMGEQYSGVLTAEAVLTKSTAEELATIRGKRLLLVSEAGKNTVLNDGNVKTMSSSDALSARQLHEKRFTLIPSWTPILPMNSAPKVSDTGKALWERLKIVPFTRSLAPEEVDSELGAKLQGELPGILAWAIRGAQEFAERGYKLPVSKAVQRETDRLRNGTDVLAEFIEDFVIVGADLRFNRTKVSEAFELYMMSIGRRTWSSKALHEALVEKGVIPRENSVVRSNGVRYWPGLRLRNDKDPEFNPAINRLAIEKLVEETRLEVLDDAQKRRVAERIEASPLVPSK